MPPARLQRSAAGATRGTVNEPAAPSARSHEALLAAFRERGDTAALGALFDATAPELFRIATALAPDAAAAEDALQESYLLLLEHAEKWDARRRVAPWLAGILRLKIHEVRRARRAHDPRRG